MVYTPAIGALAGRECKLAPGYIKDFLEQPRFPRPEEYAKFPDNTFFIDLAEASGHMSEESGLGYRARPGGSCGARCCSRGRPLMGRASPLFADNELLRASAAETGAGQGGV